MEPIFYVMAIMGCGDASQACAEQRVAPARYVTMQACQAAMPDVLVRNTDLEFPVISAACRSSGPRLVQARSSAEPRG